MKMSFFNKGTSVLLAIILCLSTFLSLGSTSALAAEEVTDEVVMFSFPRNGDQNYDEYWGNKELHFMNGWFIIEARKVTVYTIGSWSGNVCYCIEPGTSLSVGDAMTSKDEHYRDNYPDKYNKTISADDIKLFIGRIMQYGYIGKVTTSWVSQNDEDADKIAHIMATQTLIWETVVGERDADFNHVDTGDYDAVKDQVSKSHLLYDRYIAYYNSMEKSVKSHAKIPSFFAKSSSKAQEVELDWNGKNYSTTLTDTNNVLGNYTFSANQSGITFSVSGNKLTVTASSAPSKKVSITATKNGSTRKGIVVWSDGVYKPGSGQQDLVTYGVEVNDPVKGYLNIKVSLGSAKIVKTSEDGKVSGISFTITGNGVKKTVTTGANGEITIDNLSPGTYTVTENTADRYEAQSPKKVTVVSGQTATVSFNNTLKRGDLKIVKTSEDGIVSGVPFVVSGNGITKNVTTDKNGEIKIENLLPGTYTVTEQHKDYYEPQASKTVTVEYDKTATVSFDNVLKRGDLTVNKTSEDGLTEGIKFRLTGTSDSGVKINVTATVDSSGKAYFKDILIGSGYLLEEVDTALKYIVPDSQDVEIEWAKVATAEVYNELKRGDLKVIKTSEDNMIEGIKFHLYGTSLSGIKVDEYATTDKNGVAMFEDILIGARYTVEEVNTAEKYIVPATQTAEIEWNNVTSKSFENVLKRGDLKVTKTAEDKLVGGLKFHLYGTSLSGKKVDEYATTDKNGVAVFEDILIGKNYTVEEVDTAIRYVIPDSQSAVIKWNEVTEVKFHNVLKKWRAEAQKLDSETDDKAQGDATLEGAVYGVYKDGALIDTYTTDKNGYFITDYYPCYENVEWTICEVSPSEGYLLDDTVYNPDTDAGHYTVELNTAHLDVYEDIIKGKITIIKHTDDGSTKIETPEVGAMFEVYLKSAGSYEAAETTERDILTCDEFGYAETIDLPYGVYMVKQIKGWDGRELLDPFEVFISEDGEVYRYLINNANFESYLRVVKTDSTTGKVIPYAGAAFQLYDPDGNLISMSYTYPEFTTIDTFYTTEDGTLLTPEKLPYGTGYSLVELFAPYGYVLDSTPIFFDITEKNSNDEDGLTVIKVDKKNEPQMGTITIDKKGEVFSTVTEKDGIYTPVYEVKGLEGAVFGVYAVEDIYTLDGTLRYAVGEKVATITTSAEGTATTEPLFLGKFELREEKVPYGMVFLEEPIQVELVYAGQEVKITTTAASAVNERQKVVISLLKQMEKDDTFGIGLGEEYKDIQFGLYLAETITAADGTEIPKDALLEIIGIDENGLGVFTTDVPVGAKLYVKEYATNSAYQLSDKAFSVEFTYQDSSVAMVQIVVNNGEVIDNAIIRGSLEGLKVDEENAPVEKVQFGLFKADETEFTAENALVIVESDADGKFSISGIPFGKWILKELSCPAHLVMNTDTFEVNIAEQDQVVTYTIVNEIVIGNVEGIKIDDEGKPVAGVVIGLFADGTTEFTAENAIATVETGEDGVFKFENLKYGKWLIKELSCSDKYIMCEDVFEAVIDKGGVVIAITVVNKNITGTIRVVKINSKDHEQKLSGTVFHIYLDVNGNGAYDPDIDTYLDKLLEVETGIYELSGLKYNGYFIFEEQAPEGFTKDNRYFYFQIKADNEVVVVENEIGVGFTNEPIPEPEPEYPDSPQTGDNSNIVLWFGLAIGSLGLLILTLILGKKQRKVN